ncbi:YhcB family protein [Marinobacter nauticus]|uniref:YhcB family protein n=1 Tax=Marinobacter nauticus TaxID=2743 RepID=UPI001D188F46|nr:YhcB family protein [Marinobacter nauticus]MCC4270457.1 YhcB family protein [Marinobacter nauticus]
MKRKLIIHVGMGKTGSSSIQKTLRVAGSALEKQGFKYLGLMFEHLDFPKRYTWKKVNGWMDFLGLDRVQAHRELAHVLQYADDTLPEEMHTLIWSNESLFDRFSDVEPALKAVKSRYEIHVVGYVRRPDSWIVSAYMQWGIKDKSYTGPLKSFNTWVADRPYVVSSKISAWTEFSDFPVFYNFDVISDVGAHFIDRVLFQSPEVIPSLRENDTPPPEAMALFAWHNSLFEGLVPPDELESLLKRAGLLDKMQISTPYNNLLPSEEEVSNYLKRNRAEIDRTNSILESMAQPRFDLDDLKYKDYSVNPLGTNRALLRLVVHLSRDIESLKKRVAELEAGK